MAQTERSITEVRKALAASPDTGAEVLTLAKTAFAQANHNASANTYLWRNPGWTIQEAERVLAMPAAERGALWGIPISVKDCFDLAGASTSCGTRFYQDLNGIAGQDSWLVERLRAAGAVITGKTHLHPLAYGITGENPDFGDCLQPGDPGALTGGSSSGAAASVMEGSAFAAIGTDTGGSIRVPAALCGLAGYRSSWGRGDWRGGAHLAESFDTIGWLFRHLEDAPLLGSFFAPSSGALETSPASAPTTMAVINDAFLHDCEPEIVANFHQVRVKLEALGITATTVTVDWWSDVLEIFAPIQAIEAARIHRGHFGEFGESIRERLEWGASFSDDAVRELRLRHDIFRERMDALLAQHQLLVVPAAPVVRLAAGADHSKTRMRLLRYTTPVSLSGMPAITIPCLNAGRPAGGVQLIAAREDDTRLLALAAKLGTRP